MDIVSRVRPVRAAAAALVCATLALLPASASAGVAYGDIVAYPMTFPVVGDHYFADTFGAPRAHARGHEGQDIMADKGTPVVAAAAGTIRLVNWTARSHLDPERCCSVVVDHDDGWQSKYLHLTDDSPGTDDGKGWGIAAGIVPGAEIAAGQLLGWVGDSGNAESTAPHLHFELLDSKGIHVNAFEALLLAGGNPPPSPWGRLARVGVLRPGQEGQAITLLQEVLSELSYDVGPVDGIFGSKTAGGVRAYQSDRGLSVDGIIGTETFGELAADGSLEPAVLGLGSSGPQVAGMQGILTDLGFEPGPVDGVFGHRTLVAVLSFQRALNL